MTPSSRKLLFELGIPCVILLLLTLLFRMTDLDRELAGQFYQPLAAKAFDRSAQPWRFLYDYGKWPGIVSAIAAGAALVAGFFIAKLQSYRKASLFVLLLLSLGPGLVVNTIFKDNWGRPRPVEIKEFKGKYDFLPVWTKGEGRRNGSFPSGHAAMAFFMIFPYFLLKDRHRKAAFACLAFGLAYGVVMGFARMAQGGHFASDVLWSGGFVYLLGLGLYHTLRLGNFQHPTHNIQSSNI
jgi:membrane-associated PAP2 superfamily phosphatase